jgi:hypothetical protein
MRAISATRLRRRRLDGARRRAGAGALADDEVVVGAGRDLRQVRDRQHLAVAAELLHQAADGLGDGAADAGIDLVEDQRRRRGRRRSWLGAVDGDGQRDARQLAARSHLAERPRRAAGVAGDQELDRSPAERLRRVGGDSATSKRPPAMPSCCIACVTAAASCGAAFAPRLRDAARLGVVGSALPFAARSSASRSAAASSARSSACHCASSAGSSAGGA